jgi:CHAT domain-containing protein
MTGGQLDQSASGPSAETRSQSRWFWLRKAQAAVECDSCGRAHTHELIAGFDWRDFESLAVVRGQYPELSCPACGQRTPNPFPIVQLRPGDPIRVLIVLPAGSTRDASRLEDVLADLADGTTIPGTISTADVKVAEQILSRYTGIDLCGLDSSTQSPAAALPDEWLRPARSETHAAQIVHSYLGFLSAADKTAAEELAAANPALLENQWAPVRANLAAQVRSNLQEPSDVETLDKRINALDRLLLLGNTTADGGEPAAGVIAAIDHAISIDPKDETGERRHRLLEAVDTLRQHAGEDPVLLIGALNSTVAALISLPRRTPQDLKAAVALADELLALSAEQFGLSHHLVRRARNDRTVALMELADHDRESTAIDELTVLVGDCAHAEDPLIVDALLNLAVAHGESSSVPTADGRDEVISLLRLADHIRGLLYPYDTEREVMFLNNVGAALRRGPADSSMRVRNREAVAAYERAQRIDEQSRVLRPSGRFQLETNLTTARAEAALAHLTPETLESLIDEMDRLRERATSQFAPDHDAALEATANLAGIAVDAYDASHQAGFPSATLLDRAEEWSMAILAQTRERDDLALRAKNTLAVANARPLTDGNLRDAAAAITGFEAILDRTDDTTSAGLRRATARNLAQVRLGRGEWAAAGVAYGLGVLAAQKMIDDSTSVAGRLAEIEAAADLSLLQALCLLQTEQIAQAIDAIENVRRRLAGKEHPEQDLSAVLGGDEVIAWLFTCTLGSGLVAVRRGQTGTVLVDALNSRVLSPAIDRLTAASTHTAINEALADLADLTDPLMAPLHDFVDQTQPREVLLIAAGSMSRLPLHALRPEGGAPLNSKSVVRFLPSVRTAARLRSRPSRNGATVVVVNPEAGLPGGEAELQIVNRSAPGALSPPPGVSVRGFLLEQLPGAEHVHIASHARVTSNPWESEFDLGDPRTLTLADLLELDLPNLESVIAAACRTAVAGGSAPDELLGLGYGMIGAGAAEVICSLWEIDDTVTALLLARLYETRASQSFAIALTEAQRWCAALTVSQLRELTDTPPAWLPVRLVNELRARLAHPRYADPATTPFASPSYWGGLIYVGR